MERLNGEAEGLHIWLRTQANAPAQRPWFHDGGLEAGGQVAAGRVGANQMKAAPHRWRWSEVGPYLGRIADIAKTADVSPIEFADRQQFLLVNPGLGGRLQVASTIRCAVSIYNPGDASHARGIGRDTSPVFHYRGAEMRAALDAMRGEAGDPYDGITVRFVNPATGASVFPTLDYSAALLRPGDATRWKRETANSFYIVLDGAGTTEIAGRRFDWETNDIFVIPNFLWRRHINRGKDDAV